MKYLLPILTSDQNIDCDDLLLLIDLLLRICQGFNACICVRVSLLLHGCESSRCLRFSVNAYIQEMRKVWARIAERDVYNSCPQTLTLSTVTYNSSNIPCLVSLPPPVPSFSFLPFFFRKKKIRKKMLTQRIFFRHYISRIQNEKNRYNSNMIWPRERERTIFKEHLESLKRNCWKKCLSKN